MNRERSLPTVQDCHRIAATCACSNLRKAARAVTQFYEDALRPLGLRATQFPLLIVAHGKGEISVTELAELLVMDRTTLTRNLRPLVRSGMVGIRAGEDRRVKNVSLTEHGRDVLAQAYGIWQQTQQKIAEQLGGQRMERLLGDLSATVEVSQRHGTRRRRAASDPERPPARA